MGKSVTHVVGLNCYLCPRMYKILGGGAERFGKFFSIRKSYFLQVKSLILVGTLEKYQFLILIIPKAFLICVVGYGLSKNRVNSANASLWIGIQVAT